MGVEMRMKSGVGEEVTASLGGSFFAKKAINTAVNVVKHEKTTSNNPTPTDRKKVNDRSLKKVN